MSNNQPLVSILINNYNYARFVGDAIESALGQTYAHTEVIVVDDGSTDNSRDVIEGYGGRVVAVFKKNGGQASAMNAGFAASNGDIICLLDADDAFLPEKAAEVVNLFQTNPGIDWVFTESAPIEPSDLENLELKDLFKTIFEARSQIPPRRIDFRENLKNAQLPNFTPSTSNLCFSRAILEKMLPLPEVSGSSGLAICDTYLKLVAVGLSVGCVTVENLGIFRLHYNNRFTTQEANQKRKIFAEILIATGYWMRENFPEFQKLSKKLFAKGWATYLSSKSPDDTCKTLIEKFLSETSWLEKFTVSLMTSYYLLRLRSKTLV